MKPTLTTLQHRWQRKTGSPMPESIARLPIADVERAVLLTYEGHIVFVPSDPMKNILDGYWNGDSMRERDGNGFY